MASGALEVNLDFSSPFTVGFQEHEFVFSSHLNNIKDPENCYLRTKQPLSSGS